MKHKVRGNFCKLSHRHGYLSRLMVKTANNLFWGGNCSIKRTAGERDKEKSNCMRDLNELKLRNQHHRRSDFNEKIVLANAYWLTASHDFIFVKKKKKEKKTLFYL